MQGGGKGFPPKSKRGGGTPYEKRPSLPITLQNEKSKEKSKTTHLGRRPVIGFVSPAKRALFSISPEISIFQKKERRARYNRTENERRGGRLNRSF